MTHIDISRKSGNERKAKTKAVIHDVQVEEGANHPHYKAIRKL